MENLTIISRTATEAEVSPKPPVTGATTLATI
jgi:hypothetical protein